MKTRLTFWSFLITILILVIFGFYSNRFFDKEEMNEKSLISIATSTPLESKSTHLGFVGDIMLARSVAKSVWKNGNRDYHFPFNNIANDLKRYDFLFGNLEGNISSQTNRCGSIYSFNMATSVAKVLKDENFSAVSVASNHSFDYCYKGFLETLANLKREGVIPVGGGLTENEAYSPRVISIKDSELKIGMLAFSAFGKGYMEALDGTGGIAITNDINKICSGVAVAKLNADLVIVSLHFGTEYEPGPGILERDLAENIIDCGADLIVGHHPHVVQPLEQYNGKYIAYSLGNFIFDQYFSEETMNGALLDVEVKDKKIVGAKLLPTKINSLFQVEIVGEK